MKTTQEKLTNRGIFDPVVGINETLRMLGWQELHKNDILPIGVEASFELYKEEFPDQLP